ncbi:hypothetical protein, conserved [Babesia ovata]|uniref:Extracellular matrix-binding ebh n=1 Tax=Babesia ovata TaxID=189622 RepID=A0A2H6K967_9APIC|nr:uncharacterized protein BOVATA_010450 [Babesia ovata]GBE59552.1 hypothetical protein, conserved [Babesia ovata]
MAFLHGVLKDVCTKQTYNVGRENLKRLVDEQIKPKLCQGHGGFSAAIGQVANEIRKYNTVLKSSNVSLTSIINRLIERVAAGISGTIEKIPNENIEQMAERTLIKQAKDIGLLSEKYVEYGNNFEKSMGRFSGKIDDLNKDLRIYIGHVRKNIKYEVKRVETMSNKEKENYVAMMKIVKKLGAIKADIIHQITEKVTALFTTLNEKVTVIHKLLEEVSAKLKAYIEELDRWIQNAAQIIDNAGRQINIVLGELKVEDSDKYPYKISQLAEQIGKDATVLHGNFEAVKKQFEEVFKTLKGEKGTGEQGDEGGVMGKLLGLEEKVTEDVPNGFDKFNTDDDGWGLKSKIESLTTQIGVNVEECVEKLSTALKEAVAVATVDDPADGNYPGLKALQKNALGDIRKVGAWLGSAAGDDDRNGPGAKLERVLNHFHEAKKEWESVSPSNITIQILKGIKEEIGKKATEGDDFNSRLFDLLQGAAYHGIGNIYGEITSIVEEKLEPIKNDLQEFVKQAQDTQNAIETQAGKVSHHLSELCLAVNNPGGHVKTHLETLKNTYFKDLTGGIESAGQSIRKIKHQLSELLGGAVSDALKDAKSFIEEAPKMGQQTIDDLKSHIEPQLEAATKQLTTDSHKHYFSIMKDILTNFAEKVNSELQLLPKQIEDDLAVGFKGYVDKFGKQFVNKVKEISGITAHISSIDPAQYSPLSQTAKILCDAFRGFFDDLEKQTDFTSDFHKVQPIRECLAKLLTALTKSEHFDARFSNNLDELEMNIADFKPTKFDDAKSPLILEALRRSFTPMVRELKKAYVSHYSGRQWYEKELGDYAKICLTITPILHSALKELKEKLESDWKGYKIYNPDVSHRSLHKLFFNDHGYDTGVPDEASNGELNHRADCAPGRILSHLTGGTHKLFVTGHSDADNASTPSNGDDGITLEGVIPNIYDCLKLYFSVCHFTYIEKPTTPCNIYQMLLWLTGLQFNGVYEKLRNHVRDLFLVENEAQPPEKNT